ncbi:MAG: DUF2480 family protein [Flavobacteriales bacterium]|jgi:hypothetical protein|nr:DUF2480 family protein [Flavobacteriales bacterium]MDG1426589.1 DUF2480 family protein [Flavobacteriales bacterium]MDG1934437.1 DUF2480 family protein [Flavobacteriales bacterium]MDG2086916.1 DUF2480 family protein [Flavobacteriales bacterium]|tara:strand:- start:4926 stop:5435 length:510 start_codon:yes stop_codon:yes gene_type:complete
MVKEIVNRVAQSELITIDFSDFVPKNEIIEFDLKQFLFRGTILKEKEFRIELKKFDVSKFHNKEVALFCSSDCIIPMWAYMLATSKINDIASEIYSGSKSELLQKKTLANIQNIDTGKFINKKVIVKGCGQMQFNEELYIAITKKLRNIVSSLMFGEACSAVPVYKIKK